MSWREGLRGDLPQGGEDLMGILSIAEGGWEGGKVGSTVKIPIYRGPFDTTFITEKASTCATALEC